MAVFLKSLAARARATPTRASCQCDRATVAERGAKLYEQHCAQCHGDQGEGVAGAYPALAGNRAVTLPVTANLVQVVLDGGFPPATARQPAALRHAALRDRASATPTSPPSSPTSAAAWGNRAAPVSELAVSQQRSGSTR